MSKADMHAKGVDKHSGSEDSERNSAQYCVAVRTKGVLAAHVTRLSPTFCYYGRKGRIHLPVQSGSWTASSAGLLGSHVCARTP